MGSMLLSLGATPVLWFATPRVAAGCPSSATASRLAGLASDRRARRDERQPGVRSDVRRSRRRRDRRRGSTRQRTAAADPAARLVVLQRASLASHRRRDGGGFRRAPDRRGSRRRRSWGLAHWIAAAGITVGTLLARRLGNLDVVLVSAWHFLLGGAVLAVAAAATEGAPAISWTPRFVTALGFLAIIGTAAAFVAWFEEIQRSALGPLTAWTFLVPVFGIGFGAILLDERPEPWTLAGLALVLTSLWFVVRTPTTRSARQSP